jgi:O-antigen ligase
MAWIPPLALIRPGMLVGIWAFAATLSRGMQRAIPLPLWYMFAFLTLMAFQVPFAMNNAWAFWGFQDFAILVLGGVMPLAMLPRDLQDVRQLMTAYFLCHLAAAIYGLLHKGRGLDGWMGDENDLALALNAAVGVGVYLLNEARGFFRKILLVASLGVMLAATVATKSRGGFVGLAALGLYMLLAGPKRGRILIAILLVASCFAAFAPSSYWAEVKSIDKAADKGDTGEARIYLWKMGWRMFLDYPIAGVGMKNFGIRAPEYESVERAELEGQHSWGRAAHSLYFTLIPEHGLIGISLFAALLVWTFGTGSRLRRGGLKAPNDPDAVSAGLLAAGLISGIVAMLITGIFVAVLYYPVLWVLMGMLAGLNAVRPERASAAGGVPVVPPRSR